ncbi:MAG: hypothetical protein KGR26_08510, partial [Cyanobacteria bacterium REEB65]|nr:hypothetical protein [Cyanobacteria bacterium REEB65]
AENIAFHEANEEAEAIELVGRASDLARRLMVLDMGEAFNREKVLTDLYQVATLVDKAKASGAPITHESMGNLREACAAELEVIDRLKRAASDPSLTKGDEMAMRAARWLVEQAERMHAKASEFGDAGKALEGDVRRARQGQAEVAETIAYHEQAWLGVLEELEVAWGGIQKLATLQEAHLKQPEPVDAKESLVTQEELEEMWAAAGLLPVIEVICC